MKIYIHCLLFFIIIHSVILSTEDVIIDSQMTFEEAIMGTKAPQSLIDSLCLLDVEYYSFDGKLHRGQVVISKTIREDIIEIFNIMKKNKFPILKAIPIVQYQWDDDESMSDNNTSAFNYRFIAGTERFSNHATGKAIDINPCQNPAIYDDGRVFPPNAIYDKEQEGTHLPDSEHTMYLKNKGWRWGGDWISLIDYHHFDLP